MVYVALLRGINVGGKAKVDMAKLKNTFEGLGFSSVKTYINSGNVIFSTASGEFSKLVTKIEQTIEKSFGLSVKVQLRTLLEIEKLVKSIPSSWVNDQAMKCDVMFLQPEIDKPDILKQIPFNPELEDVKYVPGAVIWRINREDVTRGKVLKIIGTDVYKQLTVRNINTVRKLCSLMQP